MVFSMSSLYLINQRTLVSMIAILISSILSGCASTPISNTRVNTKNQKIAHYSKPKVISHKTQLAQKTKVSHKTQIAYQAPMVSKVQVPHQPSISNQTQIAYQAPIVSSPSTLKVTTNSPSIVYYRDTPEYKQELNQIQQAIAQSGGIGTSTGGILLSMLNDLQVKGNVPANQANAYADAQNAEPWAKVNGMAANNASQERFLAGINASNNIQNSAMAGLRKDGNIQAENYTVGGIVSRDVNWNLEKAKNAAQYGRTKEAQDWYDTAVYVNKLNSITR